MIIRFLIKLFFREYKSAKTLEKFVNFIFSKVLTITNNQKSLSLNNKINEKINLTSL